MLTDRQETIRTCLSEAIATVKKGGEVDGRKLRRSQVRTLKWFDLVDDRLDSTVKTEIPIFTKDFREQIQVFDLRDLTVYEWRPGPNYREAFFRFIFKAIAYKTLHELPDLTAIYLTTKKRKQRLEDDKMIRFVCHVQKLKQAPVLIESV